MRKEDSQVNGYHPILLNNLNRLVITEWTIMFDNDFADGITHFDVYSLQTTAKLTVKNTYLKNDF